MQNTPAPPKSKMASPLNVADEGLSLKMAHNSSNGLSSKSLVEDMGLADENENSLSVLIKSMQNDVQKALDEVTAITTHDTNLEKQYNETATENERLQAALYRARRQVTALTGKLTLLEMVPDEIREERNRRSQQSRMHDKQFSAGSSHLENIRKKSQQALSFIDVPTFQQRSRTVNCFGEYIDHGTRQSKGNRKRTRTYPIRHLAGCPAKADPLPPSMNGCSCSVCNTQQSLGTYTFGKKQRTMNKSRQQILQGDRVIVRGQKLGTVKYIGKPTFDYINRLFIGVHLDAPDGVCDGEVKGTRYFSCPPDSGVFVLPHDVLSVIGRKAHSSGTTIPRIRAGPLVAQKLDTPLPCPDDVPQTSSDMISPAPTPNSLDRAKELLGEEIEQLFLGQRSPSSLVDPSVADMSRRIQLLRKRGTKPVPLMNQSSLKQEPIEEIDHAERQASPVAVPHKASLEAIDIESVRLSILAELKSKDLGDTGYITVTELSVALRNILKVSAEDVNAVVAQLGINAKEGKGINYTTDNVVEEITEAALLQRYGTI